ncbi:hypothetical protein J2X31_002062 [Flavobacterium arsenatis]|uniref:Uncharacterized protein n=1 Tax=Flavobacterium arsenatis TaxID=1484332 RepID=A0ABU1TR72_9FLAO|nr:hypothetical protein [Flavobacterium arsenatis]MDR6968047.1 hypothetical protein [Flavobacterium arsenatis]
MTNFQLILLIFFSVVLLILIFRAVKYGTFYFTSHYDEEREYSTDETAITENLTPTLEKSNFKLVQKNGNTYSAVALPTILSFSEKIQIDYNKISNSKIKVRFKSRCVFPLQIFDYGKNKRNSVKFFNNLESLMIK